MVITMGKKIGIIVCTLLLCLTTSAQAGNTRLVKYSAWELYGQEEQLEDKETPEVIQRVVDTAYDEYTKVGGKSLKRANAYTRWYGVGGCAWCSIFVTWCSAQQDIPLYFLKDISQKPEEKPKDEIFNFKVRFIPPLFKAFEDVGRVSAVPRPGYTIIFASRSGLWEMHVGIVRSAELQADGRYLIETIEGNQGNTIRHYLFLYDPHAIYQQGNMSFLEKPPEGAEERLIIKPRNSSWCVKGFGATWE